MREGEVEDSRRTFFAVALMPKDVAKDPNQREQVDFMGHGRFAEILRERGAKVSCFTCMDTGFPLAEPALRTMRFFGGDMAVAGLQNVPNPKGRRGAALRQGIRAALESLKPIAEARPPSRIHSNKATAQNGVKNTKWT